MSGYATPEKIGVNAEGVELFADQTAGAVTWINFSYQGANALTALMFVILFLFFFKIDREMPVVTKTLTERRKAECEALGIPYVSPQEQQRAEIMGRQPLFYAVLAACQRTSKTLIAVRPSRLSCLDVSGYRRRFEL